MTERSSPAAPARRPRRPSPTVEALLALLLGLVLAIVTKRPQDLATTITGDARDPILLSWVLAWPGHALLSSDRLWDGNPFAPLENSLAFSDPMLGYLPLGLVGSGPGDAVVRFHVVWLLATALAFAGTWVLVRQLGLGRTAALVAALAFAFNPWRVSQLNHVQVLSSGGIPLALAMLARGHGLRLRCGTGPARPGWALAGWATATWHISIGFGLGLQLAYVLAICTAAAGVRALISGRRGNGWPPRRLLVADGVGIVLMLAVSAALAQPFLKAVEDHPEARRTRAEIAFYSPRPAALVTAPLESWAWGRATADRRVSLPGVNEKALFPGLAVTCLAVVGLLPGRWSRRRVVLLAGSVVVITTFALGTHGPFGGRLTYLLLYEHAPGWQGVRTPSRLVTTAWLGLALLAAHGVTVLRAALSAGRQWLPETEQAVACCLAASLSSVVLLEGIDTAAPTTVRPPPAVALRSLPQPVMVLPSEDNVDQDVMRWSTDGFPRVVNGVSGFVPEQLAALRAAAARLPAPDAVEELRRAGVASLLLLPELMKGTRYEAIDLGALARTPGLVVEQREGAVVVRLAPV